MSNENFSLRVRELRSERNATQEKFGELVGVSRQTVGRWESGEVVPDIGRLNVLCNAFHVSVDWLFSNGTEIPRTYRAEENISREETSEIAVADAAASGAAVRRRLNIAQCVILFIIALVATVLIGLDIAIGISVFTAPPTSFSFQEKVAIEPEWFWICFVAVCITVAIWVLMLVHFLITNKKSHSEV